jgi:hypothetical protein
MKVAVLGPNGINDATFHVHKAGCRDIARMVRQHFVDKPWHMDVQSEREAIEVLFGDFIGTEETWTEDGGYTTWQDYQFEVRFLPCVGRKIPVEAPVQYAQWEIDLLKEAGVWQEDEK